MGTLFSLHCNQHQQQKPTKKRKTHTYTHWMSSVHTIHFVLLLLFGVAGIPNKLHRKSYEMKNENKIRSQNMIFNTQNYIFSSSFDSSIFCIQTSMFFFYYYDYCCCYFVIMIVGRSSFPLFLSVFVGFQFFRKSRFTHSEMCKNFCPKTK